MRFSPRTATVVLGLALAAGATGAQAQTGTAPPTRPAPDSSGPQSALPTAQPDADVPGGSARNGIIRPPPVGGTTPVIPPPAQGTMPVIRPPGTTGGQTGVIAK